MPNDYRVDVYDRLGKKQAVLTDLLELSYRNEVDAPGMSVIGIDGEHELLSALKDKWIFEVWRRPEGKDWILENTGLYRQMKWTYEPTPKAVLICDEITVLLSWRIVAWTAGLANRSQFINKPAETIAKTLVAYNAGTSATVSNGRIREGAISGISVHTDGGGGNSLDWYCAYDNLLKTLQDLSVVAGGDFRLVATTPTTYEFRWYEGQLGTDRTSELLFSMNRNNMASPNYVDNRQQEKTVAIVGGDGEEDARNLVIRQSDNYGADNDIEIFVPATDTKTDAGLESRGDKELSEAMAEKTFDFDVIQTQSAKYEIDYFLGDLVPGENPVTKEIINMKVNAVTVSVDSDGNDLIEVDVKNV